MSSKRYAPLSIAPDPPRLVAFLLLAGIGLGFAGIVLADLALSWRVIAAAALLGLGIHAWRVHVPGTHGRHVTGFGRDTRGNWWVNTAGGDKRRPVVLRPESTVFPGLVVLNFKLRDGPRLSVTLTPRYIGPDHWRHLLTALRHENPLGE